MADLRETRKPSDTGQIDAIGWAFAALGVVVAVVATVIAYEGKHIDMMSGNLSLASNQPGSEAV